MDIESQRRGVRWPNGQAQGALAPTQVAPAATGVNRGGVGRSKESRGMLNKGHTGTSQGNSVMGALAAQFAGLGPITQGGRGRKQKKTRKMRKTRKDRRN